MRGVDLRSIEEHLGRRLTRDEVDRLRRLADGVHLAQQFEAALVAVRDADPAAVSPAWGLA